MSDEDADSEPERSDGNASGLADEGHDGTPDGPDLTGEAPTSGRSSPTEETTADAAAESLPDSDEPRSATDKADESGFRKDRTAAALLAILFGSFGAHRFYLGSTVLGVLYLCFSWTLVPAVVGLLEGLRLLSVSDERFREKYGD